MHKRKHLKPARSSLAETLLAEEVKCASVSLSAGCGWAVNLSEEIQWFENSFIIVQEAFEDLTKELQHRKFSESERSQVRSLLLQFRKYARQMADEEEPISILGIMEDAQRMYELERKLKKLTARVVSTAEK